MENVKNAFPSFARTAPFSWSRLVLQIAIPLAMLIAIAIILLRSTLESVYDVGYVDPFAVYDPIAPGQPTSVLNNYPCQVPTVPTYLRTKPICVLYFDKGVFSKVVVSASGETIVSVTFTGNGLELLDLVQRWGQPDYEWETYRGKGLRWKIGVDAFTARLEYTHTRSAITQVTIGNSAGTS